MTIHDEMQSLCEQIRAISDSTARLNLYELFWKSAELMGRMSMKISVQTVEIISLKEQVKEYEKENRS